MNIHSDKYFSWTHLYEVKFIRKTEKIYDKYMIVVSFTEKGRLISWGEEQVKIRSPTL